jgi:hypothetical protein
MKKGLISSICALGLVVGATSALAGAPGVDTGPEEGPAAPPAVVAEPEAPATDCASTGFYIGAGGLYAVELFDNVFAGGDAGNSGGFVVRGGYRMHPNFAVELRFADNLGFDTDPGHIDSWSLTANGKGYFLTGMWQPYALVGLGYFNGGGSNGNPAAAASTGDGFVMRVGLGMEVCLGEHFSIGPEIAYLAPFGSAESLDMLEVSGGINYKF